MQPDQAAAADLVERRQQEFLHALATENGEFIVAEEAARFIAKMDHESPGALDDWLRAHAVLLLTPRFNRFLASTRAKALKRAGARGFKEALAKGESLLTVKYAVNVDNLHKSLGDCTREDLEFVRDRYFARRTQNAIHGIFIDNVLKRSFADAGHQKVSDALGRAEVEDVWMHVLGKEPTDPLPLNPTKEKEEKP